MPRLFKARAKFGFQPDGLVVVLDGAVVLSPGEIDVAAIVIGLGVGRVQPDGLVVVLEGAVGLALAGVAVAAAVEGDSHVGRHIPSGLDDGGAAANTLICRKGLVLVQTPRPLLAHILRPDGARERQHPEHDASSVPHDISS